MSLTCPGVLPRLAGFILIPNLSAKGVLRHVRYLLLLSTTSKLAINQLVKHRAGVLHRERISSGISSMRVIKIHERSRSKLMYRLHASEHRINIGPGSPGNTLKDSTIFKALSSLKIRRSPVHGISTACPWAKLCFPSDFHRATVERPSQRLLCLGRPPALSDRR